MKMIFIVGIAANVIAHDSVRPVHASENPRLLQPFTNAVSCRIADGIPKYAAGLVTNLKDSFYFPAVA